MPWHQQPAEEVLEVLRTCGEGLVSAEAKRRLAEHGPNLLREGKRRTPLGTLAGQFTDFRLLEAGRIAPADLRLLEAALLRLDEARPGPST